MNTSGKKDKDFKALPNDFPGNEHGYSEVIKVFRDDLNRGACATRRWGEFVLTLHTSKRGLSTLESPAGLLVCVGNVLSVDAYVRYLQTFPDEVRHMMGVLFDEYRLSDCNALMFAVNNTFRVLPAGDDFSNIYFPNNSFFLVSNNTFDVMPGDVLEKNDRLWGYRLSRWVRRQLNRRNDKDNA
jgi:hypothetical protein